MANEKNSILVVGKRKTTVARVTIKKGTGIIRINNIFIFRIINM